MTDTSIDAVARKLFPEEKTIRIDAGNAVNYGVRTSRVLAWIQRAMKRVGIHLPFGFEPLLRLEYATAFSWGGDDPALQELCPVQGWFHMRGMYKGREWDIATITAPEGSTFEIPRFPQGCGYFRVAHLTRDSVELELRNGTPPPNERPVFYAYAQAVTGRL